MRLEFSPQALEDLRWWARHNKKKAEKITRLIEETLSTPQTGTGKPEPLKYFLTGFWSRRIDQEHRLVYKIEEDTLFIASCRYHYE